MNDRIAAIRARLDADERIALAAVADDSDQTGGFEDAYRWFTESPKRVAGPAAEMICHAAVPRKILAAVRGHQKILDEIVSLDRSADVDSGPAAAALLAALSEALEID